MMSNQGMTEAETRRRRLRHWIDTDPHSMGNVERWCSHYSQFAKKPLSPTYIRQLVPEKGSSARNIGERSARNFEAIGGKPRGWLDIDEQQQESRAPADTLAALTAEAAEVAGMWLQLPEATRKSIRSKIEAELRHMTAEKGSNAMAGALTENRTRQPVKQAGVIFLDDGEKKETPDGKSGAGQ